MYIMFTYIYIYIYVYIYIYTLCICLSVSLSLSIYICIFIHNSHLLNTSQRASGAEYDAAFAACGRCSDQHAAHRTRVHACYSPPQWSCSLVTTSLLVLTLALPLSSKAPQGNGRGPMGSKNPHAYQNPCFSLLGMVLRALVSS